MEVKREEEFKVEFVENTEEEVDKKIDISLEQLSTLEQIQERNCYGSIHMKSEIEIKEESFDFEEEEAENDELKRDCYGFIEMKNEIELNEEPFEIEDQNQ
ncbi:hypothetical protein Avbf_14358, partial [Armadillidium vulgare]